MLSFISKIIIRNYKSIAVCELDLPGLAFLIGWALIFWNALRQPKI